MDFTPQTADRSLRTFEFDRDLYLSLLTLGLPLVAAHGSAEVQNPAHGVRPYGTTVALPAEYHRDLGGVRMCNYGHFMALVLMMVVLAFGLLYVAVVAEERQMQEATKPRKR